jgi:hypothetical protein
MVRLHTLHHLHSIIHPKFSTTYLLRADLSRGGPRRSDVPPNMADASASTNDEFRTPLRWALRRAASTADIAICRNELE